MKYYFLNTIRDKTAMFWLALYPIIMLTMFHFAFSGISNRDSFTVATGVDPNNPWAGIYQSIDVLDVSEMSPAEAEEALKNEISAYIDANSDLVLYSGGFRASVVKSILDQIRQMSALRLPIESYDFERMFADNTNRASGLQNFQIYFFALIGMVALQSAHGAINDITSIQANLSTFGQRLEVSPSKKWKILVQYSFVTAAVNFASLMIAVLFAVFVFGRPILERPFECLVMLVMLDLIGVALGTLIALSSRAGLGTKSGITVVAVLALSAMSGMMGVGLRNLVLRYAPWLSSINPVSAFTDVMFRINVTGDTSGFAPAVEILAVEILALSAISVLILRRRQYDSL